VHAQLLLVLYLDTRNRDTPISSGRTREREERRRKGERKAKKYLCERSARAQAPAFEATRLTRSCSLSIEMMTLQAFELRRHKSACYATPGATELVLQAVVFVAIVDNSQPPASLCPFDCDDRKVAHHDGNHNHCYKLDHDEW
jgi:hypothetical protein